MSHIIDETVAIATIVITITIIILVLFKNNAKAFMTTAPVDIGTVPQLFLTVVVVGLLLYNLCIYDASPQLVEI